MSEARPEREARPELGLIVAVAENGVIGRDGGLPWRLPEDLRHFKRTTLDHAIVMGRATWESLPGVLPRRRHIVVTRNRDFSAQGAEVAHSLPEALALARESDELPWVVGGAQLYAAALPLVTRLELTRVHRAVDGDTVFPPWEVAEWREVGRVEHEGFTILSYRR